VAFRRSLPITAYIGENGGGKTACMIYDTLASLDAGRTVLSSVPIYVDKAAGVLHPSYVPLEDWRQVLEARDCDVLLDEVASIASSRDYQSLHSHVIARLNQLRKVGTKVRWSAPSWRRADTVLREITWAVNLCSGWLPARGGDPEGLLWSPRQLFRVETYDVRDFDEWTAGKKEKARRAAKQWWIGPGSRVFDSYDTLAGVDLLTPYDPDACPDCGRPRRREYCKGHSAVGRRSPAVAGFDGAEPVVLAHAAAHGSPNDGVGEPEAECHERGGQD